MNPNSTIDNDLQKAIDDITNNTNSDPVFGEPIAAPAPVPAPEPIPAPISEPTPIPAPLTEAPEEPKPAEPVKPFPTVGTTPITSTFNPAPKSAPIPAPIAPVMEMPAAPAPVPAPEPTPEPTPEPEPAKEPEVVEESSFVEAEAAQTPNELHDVKEKVLRDLAPMVNKIKASPSEKFNLYKDIHEKLHDDSVIASAYEVSKEITDEGERADALLYLYDSLK